MIGIAHIFHHQLPVVLQVLAVRADHLHGPAVGPLQVTGHHRPEILLDGGRRIRKRAEMDALKTCNAQAFKAMPGVVEIGGHASAAAHPALEGHAGQVSAQVVGPVVVHTGELLAIAPLIDANQGSAMRAAIDHGMHLAVFIAAKDDRCFTNKIELVITWPGNFAIQPEVIPGRAAEQERLFACVNCGILIHAIRHARDTLFGPLQWYGVDGHGFGVSGAFVNSHSSRAPQNSTAH